MNLNEMKARRADIFSAADKLVRAARETGKDLAGAELEQYNDHIAELTNIDGLIKRHQDLLALTVSEPQAQPGLTLPTPRVDSEEMRNFDAFLRTGKRIKATTGLNVGVGAEGGFSVPTD